MSGLISSFESLPPMLGEPLIDDLRITQAAANEIDTLEARKQFALESARRLPTKTLGEIAWDIETDLLLAQSPEIERDEWIVSRKDLSLFARIRNVTYISGADIGEDDGLAVVITRVHPFVTSMEDYRREKEADGALMIGGLICAPVLHLQAISPARKAA
jgi:hypothetical protein